MNPTESLRREVLYFIGLNGYAQHEYITTFSGSFQSLVFWQYLREETLNRRIVEDGLG